MANIIRRPRWYIPDGQATSEDVYMNRRTVLKALGLGGMAAAGYGIFQGTSRPAMAADMSAVHGPLPAHPKNPKFVDAGRPLTDEEYVLRFNNFYEFGFQKHEPAHYAKDFKLDPYTLEVDGLVDNPKKFDLDEIEKLGLEERVYRFRCVERWNMTVPWAGVPLRKLIEQVKPKSSAKFVAFQTFMNPKVAPGQTVTTYPWPYLEGLRLDEAMNDLALIATGLYGKRLAPQSGTPLRIVVPWKFGYKGPKSIVKMTFVDRQPKTFWNEALSAEYKFYSNIDPKVPHPRWSQAEERRLGEDGEKWYPTQFYNGYEAEVGEMYTGIPRTLY